MVQADLSIEGVISTALVDDFSDGDSKSQTDERLQNLMSAKSNSDQRNISGRK